MWLKGGVGLGLRDSCACCPEVARDRTLSSRMVGAHLFVRVRTDQPGVQIHDQDIRPCGRQQAVDVWLTPAHTGLRTLHGPRGRPRQPILTSRPRPVGRSRCPAEPGRATAQRGLTSPTSEAQVSHDLPSDPTINSPTFGPASVAIWPGRSCRRVDGRARATATNSIDGLYSPPMARGRPAVHRRRGR
jgi:hypothetical protein